MAATTGAARASAAGRCCERSRAIVLAAESSIQSTASGQRLATTSSGRVNEGPSAADDQIFCYGCPVDGVVRAEMVAVSFVEYLHGRFVASHQRFDPLEIGVAVGAV